MNDRFKITAESLAKWLRWALYFIFVFGLFFTPFCHYLLHYFCRQMLDSEITQLLVAARIGDYTLGSMQYFSLLAELYTLGFVMLGIVAQLIAICRNIEKSIPFDSTTHRALKRMALLSLAVVVVYVVKFSFFPALPGLLITFTFAIIGVISSIFSQLFKKAAEYKEENEFTI